MTEQLEHLAIPAIAVDGGAAEARPHSVQAALKSRHLPALALLAGIVLCQFLLYGSSLVGRKILLPLDILNTPGEYMPLDRSAPEPVPHDVLLGDLVHADEPARVFRHSEYMAGRLPVLNSQSYAGVPQPSLNLSPYALLAASTASPRILPWVALLAALVSGLGAYRFCRTAMRLGPWPSVVAGWCYPITGFFIVWQGIGLAYTVSWLPWLMLAVERNVDRPTARRAAILAAFSALTVVSGRLDVAGQALLISGIYGLCLIWRKHKQRIFTAPSIKTVCALGCGWTLGMMLAAPDMLPMLAYTHEGARMARRSAGQEERPPIGLAALPELVMPNMYGDTIEGSWRTSTNPNWAMMESPGAGFAGLIATLVLAPLAWSCKSRRAEAAILSGIALIGASWSLNLPGFVQVLRLPGLNMMSHNRFVFATAFAIVCLAAMGIESLVSGKARQSRLHVVIALLLAGLSAWCLYEAIALPEPIRNPGPALVFNPPFRSRVERWFTVQFAESAAVCAAGLIVLGLARLRRPLPAWAIPAIGCVLVAELLHFAWDKAAQCDPSLYFPPIPAMQELARNASGRATGYDCLPANFTQMLGLHDIKGYDGVDPARLTELLHLAGKRPEPPVSNMQYFFPTLLGVGAPDSVRLSPILDMLGVRYLIVRGKPRSTLKPKYISADYYVLENYKALPHLFVPRVVETVADSSARLEKMGSPEFDASATAYVEQPVRTGPSCEGTVRIEGLTPQRKTISANMRTAGLVAIADLWTPGWKATIDGNPAPVLLTDHAIQGVAVPEGRHTIEMRYEAPGLRSGAYLAATALAVSIGLVAAGAKGGRRSAEDRA